MWMTSSWAAERMKKHSPSSAAARWPMMCLTVQPESSSTFSRSASVRPPTSSRVSSRCPSSGVKRSRGAMPSITDYRRVAWVDLAPHGNPADLHVRRRGPAREIEKSLADRSLGPEADRRHGRDDDGRAWSGPRRQPGWRPAARHRRAGRRKPGLRAGQPRAGQSGRIAGRLRGLPQLSRLGGRGRAGRQRRCEGPQPARQRRPDQGQRLHGPSFPARAGPPGRRPFHRQADRPEDSEEGRGARGGGARGGRDRGGARLRIVFAGTAEFAVPSLEALVAARHEVVLVITQPDRPGHRRRLQASPVKLAAGRLRLPVAQPERLRSPEAADLIRRSAPDLLVVVAYGQIIPREILELPARGAVNVHASLLPRHRGAAPIQQAILAGDRVTGVTIMRMDDQLDHGPILAQRETEVGPDEDAATLTMRLARLGADLLVETIARLDDIQPREQDHGAIKTSTGGSCRERPPGAAHAGRTSPLKGTVGRRWRPIAAPFMTTSSTRRTRPASSSWGPRSNRSAAVGRTFATASSGSRTTRLGWRMFTSRLTPRRASPSTSRSGDASCCSIAARSRA